MLINKLLNIIVVTCAVFASNSEASVNVTINCNRLVVVNCDNKYRKLYTVSDISHGTNNKYFATDEIDIPMECITFNNFKCKKNGDYDLYIKYNSNNYTTVTLNYQNNPLYIPRIHLTNIKRLDINTLSGEDPKSGEIDDIDSNNIFLDNRLLKNYDNIKVKKHNSTMPKIVCNCIRITAHESCKCGKKLCDRITPKPLKKFFTFM